MNITRDPGYSRVFWEDTILVSIVGATPQRILENDIISFVAASGGLTSYESIFGQTIELHIVLADGSDVAVTGRSE